MMVLANREAGGIRLVASHEGAEYETFVAIDDADWDSIPKIRKSLAAQADEAEAAAAALGVDVRPLMLEIVATLRALAVWAVA